MNLALKIFTAFGIPVKLHISMLIIPVFAFSMSFGPVSPLVTYSVAAALSVLLFGSVLAHELGHALVGRRYGVHTADIILTPIGGMARMNNIPTAPGAEIAIAIAGPLVSLALAGLAWLAHHQGVFSSVEVIPAIVSLLFEMNLILALFNLIPALPMDGGRILRGLLSIKYGFLKATVVSSRIGRTLAVIGGIYGIATGQWSLVFIAVFVYIGAGQELSAALYREAVRTGGAPGMPFGFPFRGGVHVEYRRGPQPSDDWSPKAGSDSPGVKVVDASRVEVLPRKED